MTSKILSFFALMMLGISAHAQQGVECFGTKHTLLGHYGLSMHPDTYQPRMFNLYVEGGYSLNQLGIQNTVSGFHVGAGATYIDKLSIGMMYGQNFGRFNSSLSQIRNTEYKMQYFGGELQYTLFPNSLFSVSFPMQVAIAGVSQYTVEGSSVLAREITDYMGFIIPGAKVELNVTNRMKLGLSANYRIGVQDSLLPPEEIDGLNFQLLLRYKLLR